MKDTQKQDDAINESCTKNSEHIQAYPPLLSMSETSKEFLKMFINYMFLLNCGVASSLSVINFKLYKFPVAILIVNTALLIHNIIMFHYSSGKIKNTCPKIDSKIFNILYYITKHISLTMKFLGLHGQIFIFLFAVFVAWSSSY